MARSDGSLLLVAGGLGLAAWYLYKRGQAPGSEAIQQAPSADAIVLSDNLYQLKNAADAAVASLSRAPGIPGLQPEIPVYVGAAPLFPGATLTFPGGTNGGVGGGW